MARCLHCRPVVPTLWHPRPLRARLLSCDRVDEEKAMEVHLDYQCFDCHCLPGNPVDLHRCDCLVFYCRDCVRVMWRGSKSSSRPNAPPATRSANGEGLSNSSRESRSCPFPALSAAQNEGFVKSHMQTCSYEADSGPSSSCMQCSTQQLPKKRRPTGSRRGSVCRFKKTATLTRTRRTKRTGRCHVWRGCLTAMRGLGKSSL
jgi:hypothetical protein